MSVGARWAGSKIVGDIRRTIVRLDDQRRVAAELAGRALVTSAEAQRACREQLQTLTAAAAVAADAETLARRAGTAAPALSASEASAFEQTAAGLRSVQDVLAAAAEPIRALLAGADANVEQARQVLLRSREVVDEQIRAQLRLLRTFERAERVRIAAEIRTGMKPDRERRSSD